jgi:DNA polymerase-3 subunit alpha
MAFAKIEDETGEMEVILFPSVLQQTAGLWERDHILIVRGKVSAKGRDGTLQDELKIIADDAREVTHEQATAYQATGKKKATTPKAKPIVAQAAVSPSLSDSPRVYIRVHRSEDQELLMLLKRALDERPGDCEVVLVLGKDDAKQIIRLPTRIRNDQNAIEHLRSLVGDQNVIPQ